MTIKSALSAWHTENGKTTAKFFDILVDGQSMEACLTEAELADFTKRVIEILKDYQ